MGRVVYGVACLLLVAAFFGLRRATNEVAHYSTVLATGAPARVYQPGPALAPFAVPREGEKLGAVAIAHGFSGTQAMMSALARALARSGYVALTLDLAGHGQNPARFDESFGPGRARLVDDVQAAVEFLRALPHVDGERVAVIGHSMGAGAVLQYGARDPSVAAVVPISGGFLPHAPYPPPNVFLIWAAGDPGFARERLRELGADLAGLEQLVADRTYGDPERGTGLRVSEVPGVDHLTILYSPEMWRRVLEWLRATLGAGSADAADPPADGRFLWSALGLVAALVLLFGAPHALAGAAPRVTLPAMASPGLRLALYALALVAGALALSGGDSLASRGPFAFLPIVGARDLLGYFLLTGLALSGLTLGRGAVRADGLDRPGTWTAAFVLFAFTYLLLGTVLAPFSEVWLSPARAPWFLVGAALALPFFGATEWWLRGVGVAGVWLPIAGRALVFGAVLAGAALGFLPRVLLLAVGPIPVLFALLELVAYRLSRVAPNPWLSAIYQSLVAAWIPAATFPLTS